MTALLPIGEFSRLTFLSVKALRHYHEVGVLVPTHVDASTGYRSYGTDQVGVAQLIRRLRALDMPLDEVRRVVATDEPVQRDRAIAQHLDALEEQLARTKQSVDALRSLLLRSSSALPTYRHEPVRLVLARHGSASLGESEEWVRDSVVEIRRAMRRAGVPEDGPPGALIPAGLFEDGHGALTAFVPYPEHAIASVPSVGELEQLPAANVAVLVHIGPYAEVCHTYGVLGSCINERGEGAPGPTREHFVHTHGDTDDPSAFRTEICWPVHARMVAVGAR